MPNNKSSKKMVTPKEAMDTMQKRSASSAKRRSIKKPKPVSVPGTVTAPYAKKPGMGAKKTNAAIQGAARKAQAALDAKARQKKARVAASRVAPSGSVTSAKAKGKAIGPAAKGVAKAAGVQGYALPKKRKGTPRMGAGVPGFTYGRDTE